MSRPCMQRCTGLGLTDNGAVAGNNGVDVADRVGQFVFLLLEDALIVFLSAGEGRLRAGLLVTLDSSPLEDAFGRFEPVVLLHNRPVFCDEFPEENEVW